MQPLLQWKSSKYCIFCAWVCVCSLRYPACNVCESYCHMRPVWLYSIFPHYTARFSGGKKLLNTKCVFWFSLQLISETFLVLRRNGRDMVIGLHVKYQLFLSDINGTWIFLTDFRKIIIIKFHENPSWGTRALPCGWTDGQANSRTDMTKLIVAFAILQTRLRNKIRPCDLNWMSE